MTKTVALITLFSARLEKSSPSERLETSAGHTTTSVTTPRTSRNQFLGNLASVRWADSPENLRQRSKTGLGMRPSSLRRASKVMRGSRGMRKLGGQATKGVGRAVCPVSVGTRSHLEPRSTARTLVWYRIRLRLLLPPRNLVVGLWTILPRLQVERFGS